jgi:hypothetical protein
MEEGDTFFASGHLWDRPFAVRMRVRNFRREGILVLIVCRLQPRFVRSPGSPLHSVPVIPTCRGRCNCEISRKVSGTGASAPHFPSRSLDLHFPVLLARGMNLPQSKAAVQPPMQLALAALASD